MVSLFFAPFVSFVYFVVKKGWPERLPEPLFRPQKVVIFSPFAQDDVLAVQQVSGGDLSLRVGDTDIVEVGAAGLDGALGLAL